MTIIERFVSLPPDKLPHFNLAANEDELSRVGDNDGKCDMHSERAHLVSGDDATAAACTIEALCFHPPAWCIKMVWVFVYFCVPRSTQKTSTARRSL